MVKGAVHFNFFRERIMPHRNSDINFNPSHDLLTEVLHAENGQIVSGCYSSKHGGDEDGNLLEADDLEQPFHDNECSHMMADSQGFEASDDEQDTSGDPLDAMLAAEAEYEAWVAAEAAREAVLLDSWWQDSRHPFFRYQQRKGRARMANQAHLETQSVTLNVQPMRPRISGFREKGERHKPNFMAMC